MFNSRQQTFQDSSPSAGNPHYWLMLGICGSGMRAFAEMLLDAGENVIGTDCDDAALANIGRSCGGRLRLIPWGHCPDWNSIGPLTVVHTLAVSANSTVVVEARKRGICVQPLPQALAAFLQHMRQICISGTHGKTTTSGMIWWILNEAGKSPAGFVGGEFCGIQKAGSFGNGQTAVVESCEYQQSFLHLNPQTAVVTGIESDHFDCFRNDADANHAYQSFMRNLPHDGTLILNAENVRAAEAARSVQCRVLRYGLNLSGGWSAKTSRNCPRSIACDRISAGWRQTFDLLFQGTQAAEVTLRIPGLHNVENAIAALLAVQAEGLSLRQAVAHLSTFPGMRRRFEYRGAWRGIDLVDDYAHHPTAIAATLKTAREVFGGRKIIAVFEPHQVSRTEQLFAEFTEVLSKADECLILPVLPARETVSSAACTRLSGQLVRRISERGGRAFLMANLDQVPGRLDHAAQFGDVVITMGAGRTYQIHDEIHRRLQRDFAA